MNLNENVSMFQNFNNVSNHNVDYLNKSITVLNNLIFEYKNGFESLKKMIKYVKDYQVFDDETTLKSIEWQIFSIENDLQNQQQTLNCNHSNFDWNTQENQLNKPNELADSFNFSYHTNESSNCNEQLLFNLNNTEDESLTKLQQSIDCLPNSNRSIMVPLLESNNDTFFHDNMIDNQCDLDAFGTYPTVPDSADSVNTWKIDLETRKFTRKIKCKKNKLNNKNKSQKQQQTQKKLKQNFESRIWYKCGWEGCSFGSFYNGVVKRHGHKRHNGKIKIDKLSNSTMHRFKCDWPGCDVSLVAYHKLVEHKRKHTGEKPFRCKYFRCNYATARLYSMIIHERTHKIDQFFERKTTDKL